MTHIMYFTLPKDGEMLNPTSDNHSSSLIPEPVFYILRIPENGNKVTLTRCTGFYKIIRTDSSEKMTPYRFYEKAPLKCTRLCGGLKLQLCINEPTHDFEKLVAKVSSIKKGCCGYLPISFPLSELGPDNQTQTRRPTPGEGE